jgi:hypothetical protein
MKIEGKLSCPCTYHGSVLRMEDVDPLSLKFDARGILFASSPGRFVDGGTASPTHGIGHWAVPRIHCQFDRHSFSGLEIKLDY